MSPILDSIGSVKGFGWGALLSTNSYESIATVTVGSGGTSTISFTSIPATYNHLQVRAMHLYTSSGANMSCSYNSGAFSNVRSHYLYGSGSVADAGTDPTNAIISFQSGATTTQFCVAIYDFLDYTNTNKTHTMRGLVGQDRNGSGAVGFVSALATNTAAISALTFTYAGGGASFQEYSKFALYGIKGA